MLGIFLGYLMAAGLTLGNVLNAAVISVGVLAGRAAFALTMHAYRSRHMTKPR